MFSINELETNTKKAAEQVIVAQEDREIKTILFTLNSHVGGAEAHPQLNEILAKLEYVYPGLEVFYNSKTARWMLYKDVKKEDAGFFRRIAERHAGFEGIVEQYPCDVELFRSSNALRFTVLGAHLYDSYNDLKRADLISAFDEADKCHAGVIGVEAFVKRLCDPGENNIKTRLKDPEPYCWAKHAKDPHANNPIVKNYRSGLAKMFGCFGDDKNDFLL